MCFKFIFFIFQIFFNLFGFIGWYACSIRANGIVFKTFVKFGLQLLELPLYTGKFTYFLCALCFFLAQQSIFIHCFPCRCIKAPDSCLSVGKTAPAESDTALLRRAGHRSKSQTGNRLRFCLSANGSRLFTNRFRLRTKCRGMFFRLCKSTYRYRFIAFRLRPKSESRRRYACRVCIDACRHCRCSGCVGIRSYRYSSYSARIGRHAEGARLFTVRFRVGSYRRTVIALRSRARSDRYRGDTFRAVIIPVRSRWVGTVIGINGEIVNSVIRFRRRSSRIFRIGDPSCG